MTMSECEFAHALRLLYFDGRIRSCQQVLLQETRSDGCLERRSRKRNTSHTQTFVSDPEFQSHFQPHCIPLSQPRSAVVALPSLMVLAKVWPTPRSMFDPRQRSVTRRSSPRGWGFVPCLSACRSFGESGISRRRGHRRSGSARPPHACKVPSLQCCFACGVCRDNLQTVMNIAPCASSNMPCPMERSTRTGAASADLNTKVCSQPAES